MNVVEKLQGDSDSGGRAGFDGAHDVFADKRAENYEGKFGSVVETSVPIENLAFRNIQQVEQRDAQADFGEDLCVDQHKPSHI